MIAYQIGTQVIKPRVKSCLQIWTPRCQLWTWQSFWVFLQVNNKQSSIVTFYLISTGRGIFQETQCKDFLYIRQFMKHCQQLYLWLNTNMIHTNTGLESMSVPRALKTIMVFSAPVAGREKNMWLYAHSSNKGAFRHSALSSLSHCGLILA